MLRFFIFVMMWPTVQAHGMMNWPVPRENRHQESLHTPWGGVGCAGEACGWFSEGCAAGCRCFGTTNGTVTGQGIYSTHDMMKCPMPTEPTIASDSPLRTFNMELKSPKGDWTKYRPWRAPGSATPLDACGIATDALGGPWPWAPEPIVDIIGRWQDAHHLGGRPAGHRRGDKGTDIPEPKNVARTLWQAGGRAVVSHALAVNHGGGYQYRLCPKTRQPTEECFQSHPLAFARNTSTIHFEDGSKPDIIISALDVSEGVVPVNSTWRRNPIPACGCDGNDDCGKMEDGTLPPENFPYGVQSGYGPECPTGLQFPPPCEGCFGWTTFSFSTVDEVIVPSEPGEYMLSWRWDCEQSPQVWNSCADITIVKDAASVLI